MKTIWRCHIGLDERTEATKAVWRFMRPYLSSYQQVVFSVPEYVPAYLRERCTIINPAIDPLSHKNRDLNAHKMIGILCNCGLQHPHHPVATPNFQHPVQQLMADGSFQPPDDLGLLFRPTVLQVSRWDRLKGWVPLLNGFVKMKQNFRNGDANHVDERYKNRLDLCRLILAGPDPASVADDPEGKEVFDEMCTIYRGLSPQLQREIAVIMLPMESRKENALIVNALQRFASLVVQNSLREGFGLTVTEAMWKHVAVLGTEACGVRLQIRDGQDGLLTKNAEDSDEIAEKLTKLLADPLYRDQLGRSAQRRVYDRFLVFTQVLSYFRLLTHTG